MMTSLFELLICLFAGFVCFVFFNKCIQWFEEI